MKSNLRKFMVLSLSGAIISAQAYAAETVPGFGAAGSYNPALPITPSVEEKTPGGEASGGATSTLGVSTPVIVGGVVVVAAAAAVALGASSGSGGGSSAPTHQ